MNILYANVIAAIGGSERYLLNLMPALEKKGYQCTFLNIYLAKDKDIALQFSKKLRELNISVNEVECNTYFSISLLYKISLLIKEGNYDIVHSHLLKTDVILSLVKRIFLRNILLVSTKHGYNQEYMMNTDYKDPSFTKNPVYRLIAKFTEGQINKSFAVSKAIYNLYTKLGICKTDKLEVIYHGIDDTSKFSYDEALRLGNPQLVIVGRLTKFKGHKYAIEALQILKDTYPNIKLVIVGTGEMKVELEELVKRLKLESFIHFSGFSNRPLDYMHTSDITLIPSLFEPFGLVCIEAMVSQSPIVAFDVPAPNEIIINNETGLLAIERSTSDLVNRIKSILSDKVLSQRLVTNALNDVKTKFSFNQMVNKTENFYESIKPLVPQYKDHEF